MRKGLEKRICGLGLILCLCLLIACGNTVIPAKAAPSLAPSIPSHQPSIQPLRPIASPEPQFELPLAAEIYEMQRNSGEQWLTAQQLRVLFEKHGVDTSMLDDRLSSSMSPDASLAPIRQENEATNQFLRSQGEAKYAILRLNFSGEGVALLFTKDAEQWISLDWFRCAEPGYLKAPESRFVELQTGPDTSGVYAVVSGRRDHGSARFSVQTDWYDVSNGRHALTYMSQLASHWADYAGNWGYDIRCTEDARYEGGALILNLTYRGLLVNPEKYVDWDARTPEDTYYEDDWQVQYIRDSQGVFQIRENGVSKRTLPIRVNAFNPYEQLTAKDMLTIFPDVQKGLQNGTEEQKAFLERLKAAVE